jgi:hypothetical protein
MVASTGVHDQIDTVAFGPPSDPPAAEVVGLEDAAPEHPVSSATVMSALAPTPSTPSLLLFISYLRERPWRPST